MPPAIFEYTIENEAPTQEQAKTMIAWLEAEKKERLAG